MVRRIFIAAVWIVICGFSTNIFCQIGITIKLENSSFEDEPSQARVPSGWFDCGFAGESPPDTHPIGTFGVNKAAHEGDTYLGMVVRDNNTWEAVGQRLVVPLSENMKYSFSLYACQSEFYMSKSQITGKDANYTVPAIIKIWGGDDYCGKKELLAQSQPIDFKDWKKLEFTIAPKKTYRFLMIEAFYIKVFKYAYNGNILIDNASAIVPILDKN